jgi:hypothetical protein
MVAFEDVVVTGDHSSSLLGQTDLVAEARLARPTRYNDDSIVGFDENGTVYVQRDMTVVAWEPDEQKARSLSRVALGWYIDLVNEVPIVRPVE